MLQLSIGNIIYGETIKWYIGEGEVSGANITPEEAREKAKEQARINALEKCGFTIESIAQMVTRADSRDKFVDEYFETIRKSTKAVIIDEEILEKTSFFLEDGTTPAYRVKLKIKVIEQNEVCDPSFRIDISLNKSTYNNGESMIITATPTKECYLYLFALTGRNIVEQIFPQKNGPRRFCANHVFADIPFIFPPPPETPNEVQGEIAIKLPIDKKTSSEWILAVATKKDIPYIKGTFNKAKNDPESVPLLQSELLEFNRWLTEHLPSERVVKQVHYLIVE